MIWYYKFLVKRPFLVVLAISILSIACIIVSLTKNDLPDFSSPTLGFEARGTHISQRLTAWSNLLDETKPSGELLDDPTDFEKFIQQNKNSFKIKDSFKKGHKHIKKKRKKKKEKLGKFQNNLTNVTQESGFAEIRFSEESIKNDKFEKNLNSSYDFGYNKSSIDEDEKENLVQSKITKWNLFRYEDPPIYSDIPNQYGGFFCGSPAIGYSHLVVERSDKKSNKSIFELNSLLAMCQLEREIQYVKDYSDYCERDIISNECCRPWSLSNYIALLSNKSTCFEITHEDVSDTLDLLSLCVEYFRNFKLSYDCNQNTECRVPPKCIQYNAAYNILNFLTDQNFMKFNGSTFLTYSMIFVPIARSTAILPFFYNLEEINLKTDLVMITAMDLGLKNALFDKMLLNDGWLMAFGLIFITMCMWLYTSSLLVTIMTHIAVMFSLGIAYFVYTLILDISFFPFMNILAIVVLLGIGADDAFIFVKIWQCTFIENERKQNTSTTEAVTTTSVTSFTEQTDSNNLHFLMATTFKHAAISIFVTSLTTASAFFSSIISSITSVKCFGIFAGTAIVSNYFLMITWLPASISIMERISCPLQSQMLNAILKKIHKSIEKFGMVLEKCLIQAVMSLTYVWIILFGSIGIISFVIVLYWPSLQLPNTSNFPLFVSNHPFEAYDIYYKNLFWFEKLSTTIDNPKLPLRFVWGIKPIDDGDYLNPFSRGKLHFDNNFNISAQKSQIWLLKFCRKLKSESFYSFSTFGILLPNCFIENFITWMERKCVDLMDNADRSPCCEISKFPFRPEVFEYCLPLSISNLYSSPRHIFLPGVAGPKFSLKSISSAQNYSNVKSINQINDVFNSNKINETKFVPIVKALVVEFESNFTYSMSYLEMKHFYDLVKNWFDQQIANAPNEMKGGWFISELEFFDLQSVLSTGTILSIIVAMTASLFVLLLVTLNILISIYAVITVTFIIFVTVSILILFGWKLNILESISVSTAIGLAVDFSLHYCIHYRFSPKSDRISATIFSLSRIIGPTSMAALTTGLAGAIMLASNILPYIQIGIFLVTVMTVSWFYSTFFLMSLLKVAGPQYGFMQYSYPKWKSTSKGFSSSKGNNERKESQVNVKEHLLTPTSSAMGELIHSESHELDSLTSNSLVKTVSDFNRSPLD